MQRLRHPGFDSESPDRHVWIIDDENEIRNLRETKFQAPNSHRRRQDMLSPRYPEVYESRPAHLNNHMEQSHRTSRNPQDYRSARVFTQNDHHPTSRRAQPPTTHHEVIDRSHGFDAYYYDGQQRGRPENSGRMRPINPGSHQGSTFQTILNDMGIIDPRQFSDSHRRYIVHDRPQIDNEFKRPYPPSHLTYADTRPRHQWENSSRERGNRIQQIDPENFVDLTNSDDEGSRLLPSDSGAEWRNGLTERRGSEREETRAHQMKSQVLNIVTGRIDDSGDRRSRLTHTRPEPIRNETNISVCSGELEVEQNVHATFNRERGVITRPETIIKQSRPMVYDESASEGARAEHNHQSHDPKSSQVKKRGYRADPTLQPNVSSISALGTKLLHESQSKRQKIRELVPHSDNGQTESSKQYRGKELGSFNPGRYVRDIPETHNQGKGKELASKLLPSDIGSEISENISNIGSKLTNADLKRNVTFLCEADSDEDDTSKAKPAYKATKRKRKENVANNPRTDRGTNGKQSQNKPKSLPQVESQEINYLFNDPDDYEIRESVEHDPCSAQSSQGVLKKISALEDFTSKGSKGKNHASAGPSQVGSSNTSKLPKSAAAPVPRSKVKAMVANVIVRNLQSRNATNAVGISAQEHQSPNRVENRFQQNTAKTTNGIESARNVYHKEAEAHAAVEDVAMEQAFKLREAVIAYQIPAVTPKRPKLGLTGKSTVNPSPSGSIRDIPTSKQSPLLISSSSSSSSDDYSDDLQVVNATHKPTTALVDDLMSLEDDEQVRRENLREKELEEQLAAMEAKEREDEARRKAEFAAAAARAKAKAETEAAAERAKAKAEAEAEAARQAKLEESKKRQAHLQKQILEKAEKAEEARKNQEAKERQELAEKHAAEKKAADARDIASRQKAAAAARREDHPHRVPEKAKEVKKVTNREKDSAIQEEHSAAMMLASKSAEDAKKKKSTQSASTQTTAKQAEMNKRLREINQRSIAKAQLTKAAANLTANRNKNKTANAGSSSLPSRPPNVSIVGDGTSSNAMLDSVAIPYNGPDPRLQGRKRLVYEDQAVNTNNPKKVAFQDNVQQNSNEKQTESPNGNPSEISSTKLNEKTDGVSNNGPDEKLDHHVSDYDSLFEEGEIEEEPQNLASINVQEKISEAGEGDPVHLGWLNRAKELTAAARNSPTMTPPMRAPTAMMDVRPPVSSQPAAAGIIPPPQQNSLMLPPLLIAQITTRLEHLSDEDKFIIHHRESAQEKKTYPQMTKLFVDKFGHFLSEDQLRRRYMKAKEKLGESPRQQQGIVSDFSRDPVFSCFSTRSESPFLRYNSTVPTADAPMITAQSQTQTDSREARPTTGGKSINSEALEAYIRAIFAEPDEEQGLTAEAGTQTEPELEVQETRAEREDSQFSERDYLQWEYFVKRQTWATEDEMEHDGGWVTVGGKHSSLQQANIAAGHEITRERNGICIGTHTRKWTYDTDNEGMANYYATDGENCIRVRVVRTLCTRTSGNPPTSKAGWLPRNVYDIRRRSTIKTTKPDDEDDLFSETEKETVTLEILDGGYLILDEANREAAKMVIDIRVRKDSKRMDDQIARSDMRKAMEKANDEREKSGGAFREEWNVVVKKNGERAREERREEVWVQAVKMKGPRNV